MMSHHFKPFVLALFSSSVLFLSTPNHELLAYNGEGYLKGVRQGGRHVHVPQRGYYNNYYYGYYGYPGYYGYGGWPGYYSGNAGYSQYPYVNPSYSTYTNFTYPSYPYNGTYYRNNYAYPAYRTGSMFMSE